MWAAPNAWNTIQRVTAYSRVCIFVFTSCTIYIYVWAATSTAWNITQPQGPMSLVLFPSYRAAQELCEQGSGPGLSFPIPFFPSSLISLTVSGDIKQNDRRRRRRKKRRRVSFPVSDYTSEFAICIACYITLKHKWTTDLGLAQACTMSIVSHCLCKGEREKCLIRLELLTARAAPQNQQHQQ